MPGANATLATAWHRYHHLHDEVLQEVHARLNAAGFATKLDLAALIAWKHVNTGAWMLDVLQLPPLAVQASTQAAFAPGLSDQQRIDALARIPGFRRGKAFTSALLAAWNPLKYGVYDDNASQKGWPQVVSPACLCPRTNLVFYFDHLRQIANELGPTWTPRDVDMALFEL